MLTATARDASGVSVGGLKKISKLLWAAAPILIGVAVFIWGMTTGSEWSTGPPDLRGNAMLARRAEGDRLVVVMHREEDQVHRTRGAGPPPRQHFEVHGFSVDPLAPVWRRRLATEHTVHANGGDTRMLGVDGDRVWFFLLREPIAVSIGDGALVANAAMIEAANPALAGLLSSEKSAYAFHDGLVLTATDATRHRIAPGTLRAEPWSPPVQRGTPKEWEEHNAAMERWAADAGVSGTEAFQTPEGLLREVGATKPIGVADPDGALMLHPKQPSAETPLHVARIDRNDATIWDVALPIAAIRQLWDTPDAVVMIGPESPRADQTNPRALLVALATANGAIQSYAVEADERANDAVDGAAPESQAAAE